MIKKILFVVLLVVLVVVGGAAYYFKTQVLKTNSELASKNASIKELEAKNDGTSQELQKISDDNATKLLNLQKEKEALQQANDAMVSQLVKTNLKNEGTMEFKLARAYDAKSPMSFDNNVAVEFIGKVAVAGNFDRTNDMIPNEICVSSLSKKTAKLLPVVSFSTATTSPQTFCFPVKEGDDSIAKFGEKGTIELEIDNFTISRDVMGEINNFADVVKVVKVEVQK